jgi:hypothetical protein
MDYCDQLDVAAGDVYQGEENYNGLVTLKKKRKCLFIWTEKNYRVFRNLDMTTGVSLLQFNESIKDATTGYLKDNKTLADGLKDVLKKLKDVVTKTYDLRTAACDLEHCVNEGCNCTQKGILTNEWGENCKDKNKDRPRPKECDGISDKLNSLYCIPKALATDVDYLFKASADVVGIQVFSNVNTLDSLQKSLYDSAKTFEKHLQDTAKKDQDELKKAQDDLVKAVQDLAKSKASLYDKRSDFTGIFETVGFFCCPDCGCVKIVDCEPRLQDCKEKICKICDEVKDTFCTSPPDKTGTSKAS